MGVTKCSAVMMMMIRNREWPYELLEEPKRRFSDLGLLCTRVTVAEVGTRGVDYSKYNMMSGFERSALR